MTTHEKLKKVEKELNTHVIGRENLTKALVLALASGEHILILGKHGEAKTMLVSTLGKVTGLKTFYKQIHNETKVRDIVGMINPLAYQQGKLELLKTPFWNSNILFFDEFTRGRSEFLDFNLEVMQERKCSKTVIGDEELPNYWLTICTSNPLTEEYNTERIDLALKDRFIFILNIGHLIEDKPEALDKILDLTNGHYETVPLTVEELREFKQKAKDIALDKDVVKEIFSRLQQLGFVFSTRFIRKYKEILQVNAIINGRDKVTEDDLVYVSPLMLTNRFDSLSVEKVTTIVDDCTLIFGTHKWIIEEIHTLQKPDIPLEAFVDKAIELLDKTKEDYAEYPKKIQETIDYMRKSLRDLLLDNIKELKPSILEKIDTQEFNDVVSEYVKVKTLTTKYFNKEKDKEAIKEVKTAVAKLKSCEVKETPSDDLVRFQIMPKPDVKGSFDEVEKLRTRMAEKSWLAKY